MLNPKVLKSVFGVCSSVSALGFAQASFVNKGAAGFASAAQICDQKSLVSIVQIDSSTDQPVYLSWNKPGLTAGVLLGPVNASTDCGAGSCYHNFVDGAYKYVVRAVNVVDDVATLRRGTVTVTKNGVQVYNSSCKAPEKAVVQCVTKDRVIYVIKNNTSNYSYLAYSNSGSFTSPELSLTNGTGEVGDPSGMAQYKFKNGAYGYEITTDTYGASSSGFARVLVSKNGQVISNKMCDAYSLGIGAL
jgi:hypothetical protein